MAFLPGWSRASPWTVPSEPTTNEFLPSPPLKRAGITRKPPRKGAGTYGVDINRNYGYEWGGGSYVPYGRTSALPPEQAYEGDQPFSEPRRGTCSTACCTTTAPGYAAVALPVSVARGESRSVGQIVLTSLDP